MILGPDELILQQPQSDSVLLVNFIKFVPADHMLCCES